MLVSNFIESSRYRELMFKKILKKLVSYKQLPSREGDGAKLGFSNVLTTAVKENKDPFVKLDNNADSEQIVF